MEDNSLNEPFTYVGKLKNGKKEGFGTLTFEDGTKYEGEFKNDLYHGNGTLLYPNGKV